VHKVDLPLSILAAEMCSFSICRTFDFNWSGIDFQSAGWRSSGYYHFRKRKSLARNPDLLTERSLRNDLLPIAQEPDVVEIVLTGGYPDAPGLHIGNLRWHGG
jgi:hypothetical protein